CSARARWACWSPRCSCRRCGRPTPRRATEAPRGSATPYTAPLCTGRMRGSHGRRFRLRRPAMSLSLLKPLARLHPRAQDFIDLTRLNRPIGIYLLLWPTLTALWIAAEGVPSLANLLIFSLGVVLTRSAGCAINDFADRR